SPVCPRYRRAAYPAARALATCRRCCTLARRHPRRTAAPLRPAALSDEAHAPRRLPVPLQDLAQWVSDRGTRDYRRFRQSGAGHLVCPIAGRSALVHARRHPAVCADRGGAGPALLREGSIDRQCDLAGAAAPRDRGAFTFVVLAVATRPARLAARRLLPL